MFAPLNRRLVPVAALLLSSVLLSACTTGGGDTPADTAEGPTVDTKFGEVQLPEQPQRVVALGWGDAETALALGVQPVGASDWLDFGGEGVGPWAAGRYDRAPEIIGTLEPEYEKIAALDPDLILDVKSSGDQDRHDRLSAIAPTVGVPAGGDNYLTDREDQVEMIATALGEQERGRQLLNEIDQAFDTAAAEHPEFADKTVTVAAYTSEGWGAYIGDSERVAFMERLGFRRNPAIEQQPAEGFTVPVSGEQLGLLDADLLITFPIYLPDTDVLDQELYRSLPVVRDGHAILFGQADEAVRSAFSLGSVLSIPYAIDQLVPRAAEALA